MEEQLLALKKQCSDLYTYSKRLFDDYGDQVIQGFDYWDKIKDLELQLESAGERAGSYGKIIQEIHAKLAAYEALGTVEGLQAMLVYHQAHADSCRAFREVPKLIAEVRDLTAERDDWAKLHKDSQKHLRDALEEIDRLKQLAQAMDDALESDRYHAMREERDALKAIQADQIMSFDRQVEIAAQARIAPYKAENEALRADNKHLKAEHRLCTINDLPTFSCSNCNNPERDRLLLKVQELQATLWEKQQAYRGVHQDYMRLMSETHGEYVPDDRDDVLSGPWPDKEAA